MVVTTRTAHRVVHVMGAGLDRSAKTITTLLPIVSAKEPDQIPIVEIPVLVLGVEQIPITEVVLARGVEQIPIANLVLAVRNENDS